MHCPSCGASATPDQKFCRTCGLSLEKVPDLLAEKLQPAAYVTRERRREEQLGMRIENWGRLVVVLGLTMFLPVALGTGIYVLLRSGNTLGALGLLIVGAFLVLGALPLAWGEYLRKSRGDRLTGIGKLGPPERETQALEQRESASLPSVTENTTELLDVENTPRK